MKKSILLCFGLSLYSIGLQAQVSAEAIILNSQVLNADSVKVDSKQLKVFFYMPYGYDIRTLAPTFQISPKATISPPSGSSLNFTSPVSYTVTAEDGITKNTYSVEVFIPTVTHRRALAAGWNWISLSVVPPYLDVNYIIPLSTNLEYIKSATASAVFYNSIGWFGDLSNLPQYEMLMFKKASSQDILLRGKEINPTVTPIPVSAGWNRIGFILKGNAKLNDAFELSTLPPGEILLKSKEASAIYYPGVGWAGDLDSLRKLNGYMMRTTASGALKYKASSVKPVNASQSFSPRKELHRDYQFDPFKYQYSANLIGEVLDQNGNYVTKKGDFLIASSLAETRGVTEAIFVPELNRYIFLLLMFSNLNQEKLNLSIKSLSDNQEKPLSNELIFVKDEVYGLAMKPLQLHLPGSIKTEDVSNEKSESVSPEPFIDY